MLFDPARHESLHAIPWDEGRVRTCISQIAADAEARFTPQGWWPPHPRDLEPDEDATQPATPLYYGACGVVWALHYLQDVGAVRLQRNYREPALLADILVRNSARLGGKPGTCSSQPGKSRPQRPASSAAAGRFAPQTCAKCLRALASAPA